MNLKVLVPFLIFLLLLNLPAVHAQGPARSIVVTAVRTMVVAGEQVQLYARTRDVNGVARPTDPFTWSSSNPSVLTVDTAGVATAVGLGNANITAAVGTLRSSVDIQVLPLKVKVWAERQEMFVGESIQIAAAALNINGDAMSGVPIRWDLTGANGGETRAASITPAGVLSAFANALVTIRATVVYTNTQGQDINNYSAVTQVLIRPRAEYRLTSLLTNQPLRGPFQLRPNLNTRMGSNDLGQIAFVASLDGLNNSLILYENGRFDVLAGSGTPGPLPGSLIWDFGLPSINNRGDVVVRADVRGNSSGLMVANRTGSTYVMLEGQSEGPFQRLTNFVTTRYSINDIGEILFRANFQDEGSRNNRTGLFKLTAGGLQLVYATNNPLPKLDANAQIDFFGMDQNGVVYFSAWSGSRNGIYRADGQATPQSVSASNDVFAGSSITAIRTWNFGISVDGTIAYNVALANGTNGVARYRHSEGQPRMKDMRWVGDVFDVSPSGDVVFEGGSDPGWGLYQWSGDRIVPIVMTTSAIVDGAPVRQVYDAFETARGEIVTQLITSASDYVIFQPGVSQVVFKAGTTVNLAANLNFLSIVPGSRMGTPYLFMGGGSVSIYERNSRTVAPIFITGQRSASETSWTLGNAVRGSAGELYYTLGSGMFKYADGRTQTVLRMPFDVGLGLSSAVTLNGFRGWWDNAGTFAVNQAGAMAFFAGANDREVLVHYDRGRATVLAQLGGPTPTPSPAGGFFDHFLWGSGVAVDDDGRIMMAVQARGGPSGLFLFDNGQWRTAAVINSTSIEGQTVTGFQTVKAVNRKFYAVLGTSNGGILAEYAGQGWKAIARNGDTMPSGGMVNWMQGCFDVNRREDIAFIANMNSGTVIVVRTADGFDHLVHVSSSPTPAGDLLVSNFCSLSLLDDRRLYFTAIDSSDRNVLYVAEPLPTERSSMDLSLTEGGSGGGSTSGTSSAVRTGYTGVLLNSGNFPYGTAVFSLTQNNTVVSETGVPASPPTTSARILVDYRSRVPASISGLGNGTFDVNTGIALVNRSSATANVTYTLRDRAGTTVSSGHGRIGTGTHLAKFIDQLKDVATDFNMPPDFATAIQFGSLDIVSDQPLSVVALRLTVNQRGETLLTTTPIADLTSPLNNRSLYFPHFADGGGYMTTITLLNTSSTVETGRITLLSDNGTLLPAKQLGGTLASTFTYSIQPGGTFVFQTDGGSASTVAGAVRVAPDANTSTPVGAGVFSFAQGGILVTESGIPSATPTTHARIYIDMSGGHRTGVALAASGNTESSITVKAFQSDGSTPAGNSTGPITLSASGHKAAFVDQFISGLPPDFTGVLDVSSSTPFAALTLRSLTNARGDFLLTTFPIADATQTPPSPIVFPHIVDGGGYVTQFIMLSSGGASSTTLHFYGDAGAPMTLGR